MDPTSPFDRLLGTTMVEAGPDRVVVRLEVTGDHLQPGALVHGGVYCSLVELAASVGAHAWLAGEGVAVGVTNSTDFLKAVRGGTLRGEATPVHRGRTLQLWRVEITDEAGDRVAHGTVRLANLREEPGRPGRHQA